MKALSRRQFLATSVMGLAAARRVWGGTKEVAAGPLGLPPGCQIFPIRKQLAKDFDGTLRQVHAAGYRVIEFCSPPGYARMDLAPLMKMEAKETRRKIEDAGVRVVSCHYQFQELKDHADERIAFARELGLEHMIVASVGRPKTMDAWLQAADELNKLGEKTRKAGIQLGFHNHGQEFEKIDGALIFEALLKRFDPKLVKSQFHVIAPRLDLDPVDVLAKHPGRFLSLHLMDWSADGKKTVPVGQGSINWKKLFAAAKDGGIRYYFVEMDMDALKASYTYLRDLKM